MDIKEIRELTGLNKTQFAEKYHIPFRSVQNWELGTRVCPDYVLELLEFKVRFDLNHQPPSGAPAPDKESIPT